MTDPGGSRRIVVGVDGSDHSLHALEWAIGEAQHTGAEVRVVLAYDSGLAWIDVGSDAEALMLAHSAENAKQALHEALAAVELPNEDTVRIMPVTLSGEAARVLVEAAHDADLLVVGSRGRGGFSGLLLGSVSQRCAERSPCPVVIVPPSPRAR